MSVVLTTHNDSGVVYLSFDVTDERVVKGGHTGQIDQLDLWLGVEPYNYLIYGYADNPQELELGGSDILLEPFGENHINWQDPFERKRCYIQHRDSDSYGKEITEEDTAWLQETIMLKGASHWRLQPDEPLKHIKDTVFHLFELDDPAPDFTALYYETTKNGYKLELSLDKRALAVIHNPTYKLFLRLDVTDVDKKGRTTHYTTDSSGHGGIPMYLDVRVPIVLNFNNPNRPPTDYSEVFVFRQGDWVHYEVTEYRERWFSTVGYLGISEVITNTNTRYINNIPYQVEKQCNGDGYGNSYAEVTLKFSHPQLNGEVSFTDGDCEGNSFSLTQLNNGYYALLVSSHFEQRGDGWGACGACPTTDRIYYITDSTGRFTKSFYTHENEGMIRFDLPEQGSKEGWIMEADWSEDKQQFIFDVVEEDLERGDANVRYYLDFSPDYSTYTMQRETVEAE